MSQCKQNKDALSRAFSHTVKELEIPNIKLSLRSDLEEIRRVHDSVHEFLFLVSLCLPSKHDGEWQRKSAFLAYHFEAFYQAHRSLLEVLSGYYNAGYVLLRSVLELLVRGSFLECLAHRSFRDNARILYKLGTNKKTLIDWINELIEQKPSIDRALEQTSAAIFDKTADIFEDLGFRKEFFYVPNLREVVEQLSEWNILDPIDNPVESVYYQLYAELSKNVHVIPDKTDIGRRLLSEKSLFEATVIPRELTRFMKVLHEVTDIGMVVELNILADWINGDEEVKAKLSGRLAMLEELGLTHASNKLGKLLELKVPTG